MRASSRRKSSGAASAMRPSAERKEAMVWNASLQQPKAVLQAVLVIDESQDVLLMIDLRGWRQEQGFGVRVGAGGRAI